MEYVLQKYTDLKEFECAGFTKLESYHWESPEKYRPDTFFKIGAFEDSLIAVLKCYETAPKAVYGMRDDPIYQDSCLEFFVAPISSKEEYINVECNSKGAFLSEFGKGKYDRVFVKNMVDSAPVVEPFFNKDHEGDFWGVKITLEKEFLSELYSVPVNEIDFSSVKANFYKCGDECEVPHYLAFSPVTTLPPGFHNPECFATFKNEVC